LFSTALVIFYAHTDIYPRINVCFNVTQHILLSDQQGWICWYLQCHCFKIPEGGCGKFKYSEFTIYGKWFICTVSMN
jgi:hypothetical protein